MDIEKYRIKKKEQYEYEISEVHLKEELNYQRLNEIIKANSIDYEKLAEAIVKVQRLTDKNDEERRKKQKNRFNKMWNKIIGYKKYKDKNVLLRFIHNIINFFSVFFHLMFFKRKNAKSDIVTFGLFQTLTSIIFILCEWVCGIFAFICVIGIFLTFNDRIIFEFKLEFIPFTLASIILTIFFRIASFEIDNIKDRTYLLTIFSAMTCFLAMIFSLITLFIKE